MINKVFFKINSYNYVYLSVHRKLCTKTRNVMFFRGFVTLPKSSNVKCSFTFPHILKNKSVSDEWMNKILSKKQFIFHLSCHPYSNQETPQVDRTGKEEPPKVKLTLSQTLKKLYKEYAYVLIPVHLVTSVIWYGSFYYLVASGVDVPAWLELMNLPDSWVDAVKNSNGGYYLAAYVIFKIATPLRYTVTVGFTTLSVKYLAKFGLIRQNKDQIQKLYNEKKEALKDLKNTCQKKMQVHKNDFMKTKKEMTQQIIEVKEELQQSVIETREGFKEGVKSAADEWKMFGRTFKKGFKKEFPFKK